MSDSPGSGSGSGSAAAAAAALSPAQRALADALLAAYPAHASVPVPDGFAQSTTMAQARDIAALNTGRLLARLGGSQSGYKLGGTNAAALEKLGLTRPFVGPILSARCLASPATMPRAGFQVCVVECELGVRMARDIGGDGSRPSRDALLAAIDTVFPVIELADCRLANWAAVPPAAITADIGYAGAMVTGMPVANWRTLDLAACTVSLGNGNGNGGGGAAGRNEVLRQGQGAAVLGHPFDALADFIAELGEQGQPLRAGQWVSTGTWTAPYMGQAGDRLVADFGPLGIVSVDLT